MIIIPDVHGRSFWKKPVEDNLGKEHIIFLGDYIDPYEYEGIAPWEALLQFEEIVELKKENPDNITLLLGNHDIHYLTEMGRGQRFDCIRADRIKSFIMENADLFQLIYTAENKGKKFLYSHAGILSGWMCNNKKYLDNATPDTIGGVLNDMWADRSRWPVLFNILSDVPRSRWGDAFFGSPIWSDAEDMRIDDPELAGYYQVFGHTQQEYDPEINAYFACLDCRRAFRLSEKDNTFTSIP
ncbi:MAG: metallophosphoesterase [Bacteroidales bacterium]|nr:metallophosphoesterase [Bacteroidales bacterium]